MAEPTKLLEENPILIYLGVILAILVYGLTRYLETVEEEEMEPPEPTTLDKIVRPKVEASVNHRGTEPGTKTLLKFGRNPVGSVDRYLETTLPKKALNPDPNTDDQVTEDEEQFEEVRILRVGGISKIDELLQKLKEIFGMAKEGSNQKFYVFRKKSFLDHPGDDMVIDPEVLSYEFAGMEIESANSTKNVVSQAVQVETQEKLMSAIPNYTEKVDYLFPLHSQNMSEIKQEGEFRNEGGDF